MWGQAAQVGSVSILKGEKTWFLMDKMCQYTCVDLYVHTNMVTEKSHFITGVGAGGHGMQSVIPLEAL